MEVWYKRYGMKRFVAVLMFTVAVSTIFPASAFSEIINLHDLPYGHFFYDFSINPSNDEGERVYHPYNICFDYLIALAHSRGNYHIPSSCYTIIVPTPPTALDAKLYIWENKVGGYNDKKILLSYPTAMKNS